MASSALTILRKKAWCIVIALACFLACSGHATKPQTLVMAPPKDPTTIRFYTFGDWGTGDERQKAVFEQTKKSCAQYGCDFGLTLGDNFYPRGMKSVDDPKWASVYEPTLGSLDLPLYVTLGNHDYRGSLQALYDYGKKDPDWILPANHYSIRSTGALPLLEIFVIDTKDFDPEAQEWLSGAVKHSKAQWKLLALHHPLLNNGTQHPSDQMDIYDDLRPIICGRIDAILAGHEHIFSHLQDTENECRQDHFVIGTGGRELYGILPEDKVEARVLYTEASLGLALVEAKATELRLRFIRSDAKETYKYLWKQGSE